MYTARHSRERETSRLLDKVFDGALDQFVVTLLKSKHANADELKKLARIIADARRKQQADPTQEP